MTPEIVLLSHALDARTPVYGNNPPPAIEPHQSIREGAASNSWRLSLHNHTGTHVDAPKHFVDSGRAIGSHTLDELTFSHPRVLEVPRQDDQWIEEVDVRSLALDGIDVVLFRTGFEAFRNEERYRLNNPGVSPEAILWIRRKHPSIRCLGIDGLSMTGFGDRPRGRKSHMEAFRESPDLGPPLLLIEDMSFAVLPTGAEIEKVLIVPWQVAGWDSAPCSVLGFLKDSP